MHPAMQRANEEHKSSKTTSAIVLADDLGPHPRCLCDVSEIARRASAVFLMGTGSFVRRFYLPDSA